MPLKEFPRVQTAYISAAGFAIYAIIGCLAINNATPFMKLLVIVSATMIASVLTVSILLDARLRPSDSHGVVYRRNVMNTFLTVLLTVVLTSILYCGQWYPARNSWILVRSSETKSQIPYPAVTFVSDTPAPFEANILGPQSCFIGQNDNSPPCDSLTEEQVASIGAVEQRWNNSDVKNGLPSCNCTNGWDMTIHPNFIDSDGKPSIHFHPSKHLVASSIQVFLNLNFTFNINQSEWDYNYVSGPDLWMLVYDGHAMNATTAYKTGYGEYTLVNVDSTTTVTMDPVYIKYRNGTATYQYHVTLNRAPNVDSTCDVSGKIKSPLNRYYPCSGLFLFRVQNFQSSVLYERRRLEWGDFGESVGAYFALIQAISWLLSALAFQRT